MSEPESHQPEKVALTDRLLMRQPLSARRAAAIIAVFTLLITLAGGLLAWLADKEEYPTFGKGLWFALQTVTTVGYGDVTPAESVGRVIAAVVMLTGIGFIAVITAAVTASLIEGSRRSPVGSDVDLAQQLEEMNKRLVRIETSVDRQSGLHSSDDAS